MQAPWFWNEWLYQRIGRGKEMAEVVGVVHGLADRIIQEEWDKAAARRQAHKANGDNNNASEHGTPFSALLQPLNR